MASARAVKTVELMENAMEGVWPNLKEALCPIKNDKDLERRSQIVDAMLDKIGEEENHPLGFICDFLGRLIEDYENKAFPIKYSTPSQVLTFLMEERGLRQKDLEHIIPQSNLSAFLRGKRSLTPLQIAQLGAQLGVSPAVFLPVIE